MRYGVCASNEKLEAVQRSGADYIECTVVGLNALSDEQLNDFVNQLKVTNMNCEALAVLFPATVKLVGSDANINEIKEYLCQTFKRLSIVQPKIIVFGSGGARHCPDDFPREKALEQLIEVCRAAAEAAKPYNITIAFEALNYSETNIINTLAEANEIVKTVNAPNFCLTADIYHMLMNGEPATDITTYADNIAHVHIAAKDTRACPELADKDMFAPFFQALSDIKYDNRLSIEGKVSDLENQLPIAFELFRSFEK